MKFYDNRLHINNSLNTDFNLDVNEQGVSLTFYISSIYNNYKDPIVEVNSIEGENLAFLSLGYNKENMNIISNKLISKGNIIKFKCSNNVYIEIGITSYEEWLSEQRILANDTNFEKLIQSKIMCKSSDVKLIVASGETKETINCHSNILCIKSPYFFNMLESDFSEAETGEFDTHCSKEAMIPILQYIYTGEIDKKFFFKSNYGVILEMYSKVCEYQITKVKSMVEVFILAFLSEDNLKILLKSTILNRDDPFTKIAIKFIANYL